MNKSLVGSINSAAAVVLDPGETVQVVASAMVGQVSAKKTIVAAAAVGVLTGGALTALVTPKKLYVVLTERRLVFLEGEKIGGKAKPVIYMEFPRSAVETVSTRTKRAVLVVPTLVAEFAIAGSEKGLKLQFPTVCRGEGQEIADALSVGARGSL